jgi:hypothetical protein
MYAFSQPQPSPDASARDLIAFARATAEISERAEQLEKQTRRNTRAAAGLLGFLAAVIAVKAAG